MARTTFSGPIRSLNGFENAAGSIISEAEFDVLAGITASAAELNIMDGVTASTAELNIMDGVTASTAELNIMDGVTSSTAELNLCDGQVATATEVNLHTTLNAANVETFTAAGANTMTLTKRIHKVDTTAGAQTCTPAAPGAANLGVLHLIEMTVDGGNDLVITQTNIDGGSAGTSITFNDAGDYVLLVGGATKWHVVSGTATFA